MRRTEFNGLARGLAAGAIVATSRAWRAGPTATAVVKQPSYYTGPGLD